MDTITATLYSPAYAGLVSGDEMYNCNKYDNRFGTSYVPPLTREQHSNREYLGAPYKFANDREDSFESNPPTNRSPSPEPEDGRRLFWDQLPSENDDADTDWRLDMLRRHYKELQEEMRADTLLAQRQRAELYAVWKDPRYHPQPRVEIPRHLQQPDENPRRGRGRPRKERNAVVVRGVPQGGSLPSKRQFARGEVAFSGAEEEPMKRKRGRPRKDGMTAAPSATVHKRQRTAAEPGTSGRYGGRGGKWKPGEAPWDVASPPPLIKVEEVGDDLVVPSSPTEGCACKPSTSRAVEVRAAREGKQKEARIPPVDEDEEMSPFNIFAAAVLPIRATRSGREFAG